MDENTELAFHDDRGNGSLLAVVDEASHPGQAPEAPAELVERAKEQLKSHPEL
ncbi:hypothetical protein [Streptomyces sp. LN785]|uniref:hypothetical protein n=1 Tax=Streptomyces sp. LN785 TaxID=3112983 RepID=UPI003715A6EE